MTFRDLLDLALPADYELVGELIEGFERERTGPDQRDFLRFCLNAPHRLVAGGRKLYHLLDCMQLANPAKDAALFGREIASAVTGANGSFALAGLRRQVSDLFGTEDVSDASESLHLERFSDDDARRLVEGLARRHQIDTNEPTRDLIVQQMNASPFFINALMLGARESKTPLTSFLNCQRLYVDELMGGYIHRHFSRILDAAAPNPQTQKTLLRVLFESASSESHKASLWAWKKRLGVDAAEFERIVNTLHVNELANSSAAFVEVNADSYVWNDYLHAQYRIEVEGEGRASVVATTLVNTLKRAPQAMARKYRREAALGLPELISSFNLQSIPASLFHYDRFANAHKGAAADDVDIALDAESDLIRLPQIVFATGATAYSAAIVCERERCVIGHGFEAADYADENEVVWLAAQIDSKLEASRELTAEWCDRLANLSRECNFARVRLWLVTPEGFSPEACELLNKRDAYGSSRQQVELISARIQTQAKEVEASRTDEYEMVIPMGSDTELIAAHTVEQIARRVNFRPEAINQIKTALIEACINAAEHSLSPDRKIYQRFRVENDRLVVTVASRGVVPASVAGANGQEAGAVKKEDGRRGWGLKLIQTLMDEVEFERVDDGTQLKMTKYLRKV
jgi:serine/threonine-protein kinase RsbW